MTKKVRGPVDMLADELVAYSETSPEAKEKAIAESWRRTVDKAKRMAEKKNPRPAKGVLDPRQFRTAA